jgi:Bifunctional DNA primase/polymerase, N-terminal
MSTPEGAAPAEAVSEAGEDALRLAYYSRPAFPCHADKRPACPHGFKDATADPEKLRELWARYPGKLVGVPTGEASGLFVIDVDSGRHVEAQDWLERVSPDLPPTRQHATKSGGWHILFKHRAGLRNTASKLAKGVDTRGDGGYIIWWPFHLGLGAPHLLERDIAELPDWLFQDLTYRPEPKPLPLSAFTMRGTSKSVHGLIEAVAGEKAGARNSVAFWAGNRLRESAHRMTRQQFDQAVQDLIRAAMSTGLSFQEAKKAVENGLKNDR